MAGNQEFDGQVIHECTTTGMYIRYIVDLQEVNKMVFETIDKILGQEKLFKSEKLKKWTDAIVPQILEKLVEMKLSFKYTGIQLQLISNANHIVSKRSFF